MFTTMLIQAYLVASMPLTAQIVAAEPQFHYVYRGESVPLRLDPSRIAVLAPGAGEKEPSRAVSARLGVPKGSIRTLGIDGWAMVMLAEPAEAGALKVLADTEGLGFVSPVFLDAHGAVTLVTPEIFVRFRDGVAADAAEAVLRAAGPVQALQADFAGLKSLYRVRTGAPGGFDVLETANALAARGDVEFAEPNLIVTVRTMSVIPNDEHFFRCWQLHSTGQDLLQGYPIFPPLPPTFVAPGFDIDAPEAWDVTTGDPSIITVVFDTGVQLDHPDLMIDPSLGRDFTTGVPGGIPGGGPTHSCDNHGTSVAGIVGARINNEIGGAGVAPHARLASAHIFTPIVTEEMCDGEVTSFSRVIEGLMWAEFIGARVTNHSYSWEFPSAAFEAKVAQTRDGGMVHFGAAGNQGIEEIVYPARLDEFFAVGGTEPIEGAWWSDSCFGAEIDAVAPAFAVFTTDRTGLDGSELFTVEDDYEFAVGTSLASPSAAGVAALVLSVKPSLTSVEVESLLRRSCIDMGDPGWDKFHGHGHINAHRAVRWAKCPVDLNLDGFADFSDYLEFLNMYEAQDHSVDFNLDGFVDFSDYLEFLNLYDAGC